MLEQLRLLSMLAPRSQQLEAMNQTPQNGMASDVDIMEIARQLQDQAVAQQPANQAEIQLREMLGQMPRRDQFKPTVRNRIAGALIGAGAARDPRYLQAAEDAKYAPYNRAVEEWGMKLKPLKELADVESSRNTNERLVRTAEDRWNIEQRKADIAQQKADELTTYRNKRITIETLKAQNASMKSAVDKDGMLWLYDITTGKKLQTGIDTGKLGDLEKHELKVDGQLEVLEQQYQNSLGLEDKRQTGRESLEGVRQTGRETLQDDRQTHALTFEEIDAENQRRLKATPSGTPANVRSSTPAQEAIARKNLYMQIISDPKTAHLKKYYVLDKAGNPSVKPLGGRFSGDIEAERNKAYELLFPPKPVATNPGQNLNFNNLPRTTQPSVGVRSDGKSKVRRKADGKTGWVTDPDPSVYELIP